MVKIKRNARVAAVILLAHSEPYLLRQQAVHDEEQRPLQTVEESENVCLHQGLLPKQEGPKHPHQAQYTHLGDGCHRESSADGGQEKVTTTDREGKKNIFQNDSQRLENPCRPFNGAATLQRD